MQEKRENIDKKKSSSKCKRNFDQSINWRIIEGHHVSYSVQKWLDTIVFNHLCYTSSNVYISLNQLFSD